jgi:hypothetical protein
MLKKLFPKILLLILLSGCGKPLPTLDKINLTKWKEDKNACLGDRSKSIASLQTEKDKLKALTESDIIKLLGRPDQNELYKRNQKFYRYLLEPGVVCGIDNSNPKRLTIRFNAIGLAKEVIIE